MESSKRHWTLGQLAQKFGAGLTGPAEATVTTPVEAGSRNPLGITFAESDRYYDLVRGSGVGAVLVPRDAPELDVPTLKVDHPRRSFGYLLAESVRPLPINEGIHPTAVVDPEAHVDPSARIGPYVVVQKGVQIAEGVTIHPFSFIGEGSVVGAHSLIYPHVVLVQDVSIGEHCTIFPGAILGADGFGYTWAGTGFAKIPQVGAVDLGDGVDVGALSTIDRATCGATTIGTGSKIDNLVQVAHNVTIGDHTVIAAQVGIAGSAKIGSGVVMGGQASVRDHVEIADRVTMAGRTGAMNDISEPGEYFGLPALPIRETMRHMALIKRLPEMANRLKELEKRIQELES
ncbi:MAG: UDP-3-O-(3-hydroxymyristoyl)glucosamine N-acyltransferase [Armatimonadetes bacterium]|nr:UDP-3-O-(3-hydroxymyristoyl)glucosamine N-acyltransferase [Armatimonadota bacterium]